MSKKTEEALKELRKFMFERVYKGAILKEERDKAKFVLYQVFNYYLKIPIKCQGFIKILLKKKDYIKG